MCNDYKIFVHRYGILFSAMFWHVTQNFVLYDKSRLEIDILQILYNN